ncbi:MAG TPA: FAD-dependent oxidoreductase [Solirubrobacteraceae bacterium]
MDVVTPKTALTETPDRTGAYPRLTEAQVETLAGQAVRRPVQAGEVLFRQGDVDYGFFVILTGRVAVRDGDPEGELLAVHGPRRFLGELSLLTGQPAFFTAVACEQGEVLQVGVERLRELVAGDETIGDLVLRAYLLRRELLIGMGAGLRIVGSRYSPDCRRLREFVARNRIPHHWIDVEDDAEAETLLRQLGVAPQDIPVVVWHGRHVLRNPSTGTLARALGLRRRTSPDGLLDLVVVGAGPAGLAAAVYGASEGLRTVALDAVAAGGQASTSSRIENYLGFPSGISGGELAERAVIQAEKFGAELTVPAEARGLRSPDGHHEIETVDGDRLAARAVLVVTGARYRKLALDRVEHFEGAGVYYAATQVEALLCRGDHVGVVGGGNSAGQATLFLSRYAASVSLFVRSGTLTESMSRYLIDQLERNPVVDVHYHAEVTELIGDDELTGVRVKDNQTGERHSAPVTSLFVFIGADPGSRWLEGQLALDSHAFVLTGGDAAEAARGAASPVSRPPSVFETSRPGVFAAGDVRSGSVKRMASAVGEGAMAVRMAWAHLAEHGRDSGARRA